MQEYILHSENNLFSRRLALRALIKASGRKAIPFLLEMAKQVTLSLSSEATMALGEMGGPEAQSALESLLDHPKLDRDPVIRALAKTGESRASEILVRQFEACADPSGYFETLLEALFQAVQKGRDPKIIAILGALLKERPYLTQFLQRFGTPPPLDSAEDQASWLAWQKTKSHFLIEQAQAYGRDFNRELAITVALTNHIELWPLLMERHAAKSPCSGQVQGFDPERHAELVLQKALRTKAEELYQQGRREMRIGGLKNAALRYLTEAIEADPTFADAYDARSNIYMSMDRIEEGLADMHKAIELSKKSGEKLRDNSIG